MASAWRIVRASRAETAFTGEGPWRYGGRWNSPGARVVYVSEHQSTAALEVFANRVPFVLQEKYKAFGLEWPDNLTEIFLVKKLPANWRVFPPPAETKSATAGFKSGAPPGWLCQAPLAPLIEISSSILSIRISNASVLHRRSISSSIHASTAADQRPLRTDCDCLCLKSSIENLKAYHELAKRIEWIKRPLSQVADLENKIVRIGSHRKRHGR